MKALRVNSQVSTVQQQQILMLHCLISAYSLSVLSLEGSSHQLFTRDVAARAMLCGVRLGLWSARLKGVEGAGVFSAGMMPASPGSPST